jgi:DNA-binding NarL/FixJ family response regulator
MRHRMRDLPIKILIVDDHPMTRTGLRGLLETRPAFSVVAEANNAKEALCHAKNMKIDVVLMDINMPDTNGIELTAQFRTAFPMIAVLIFSMHEEEEYVLQAIKAGAQGYVLKTASARDIIETINKIITDQVVFPLVLKPELLLTLRERQVLWLIGDEKSNREIARKLGIEERTVEGHRHKIWQKLKTVLPEEKAANQASLIIIAVKYRMRCNYPSDSFEDGK